MLGKDTGGRGVAVGAVRFVTLAMARYRWRAWLAICCLVSLASGFVLAATDAGDRTAEAFPDYVAAHGFDAFLYSPSPLPQIAKLPEVTSVIAIGSPANGVPVCACTRSLTGNDDVSVLLVPPAELGHLVKLVSGRMPDQADPDEVLASYTFHSDLGVHLGTVMRVPFAAPSQRAAVFASANVKLSGPDLAFQVVGISVAEFEFPATGSTNYTLYGTAALARRLRGRTVNFYQYVVKLRHGAASLPEFESQARAMGGLYVTDLDSFASTVSSSIHPQAVGWWALAVLMGLVGLIVVGQALGRQAVVEAGSYGPLRALGTSPRQFVLLGLTRAAFVAVAGAAGGVVLAFGLSAVAPVGEARLADPGAGSVFHAPVLLPGGAGSALVVFALGIWPAFRTYRASASPQRSPVGVPSRVVGALSRAGAPPTAVIGVRHALERGRGRSSVPVRSALLGAVMAVAALCGTAVFSSSLGHLTSTPSLYGQPFDAWFGANSTGSAAQNEAMFDSIVRARGISGVTLGVTGDVSVNGEVVDALAGSSLRGSLLLTAASGRLPAAAGEVALGTTTLRQVGAHIGSEVTVTLPTPTGGTRSERFRVVGSAVFPPDFGTGRLGAGAVFSLQSFLGGLCPPGPKQTACYFRGLVATSGAVLVKAARGATGASVLSQLERAYSTELNLPKPPTDLVNFGQAVNFPLIFGVVLVIFGVATLLHLLVASVSRRRQEVGLLKAIGFARSQVALAVVWQTSTIAVVGIVVGVPAGIAAGRAVWQAFAGNLGVLPVAVVSVAWMSALGLGVLLVANLLAVGPAIFASRLRPANLLKNE
ncbi:MAG TPA: FtsX-like permease family protein [Acidimicrobiales bacterium]|nr:FtsX-like permease family protein [Acidimicrobiales bacterium]